ASAGSQAGAAALEQSGALTRALGVDSDRILEQVNARLTELGKPTITAEQLRTAAQDAAFTAVRRGEFDRDLFVGAVADNTELTERDVREVFAGTTQRLEREFAAMRQQMSESAERVAMATGRVF